MADTRVDPRDARVVRLHLRSTIVDPVDHLAIEDYCLPNEEDGWAGVGWGCWDDTPSGISWNQYVERKERAGEAIDASVELLHDLPIGGLIWTRGRDSSYWLGEVIGRWEYRGDEHARALDMFNLRRCRWRRVGTEDSVPGKVVNNFRASKTVNPVTDLGAVRYTRRLHAQLTGGAQELEPVSPHEVIESLLGATDLEDLVAVYLQDRHDLVLVSRGRSTPGYEYVLCRRDTGRRAVASVKSGGDPVDLDRLPEDPDVDLYAYAVCERCIGTPREICEISTDQLAGFILERRAILPDQVARWLA